MFRLVILLLTVTFFSCNNSKTEQVLDSGPEFEHVFNGQDLDGWTVKINKHEVGNNFGNTFRVEDSILSVRYDAYGEDFDERFGAIFFDRKLSNYRLKLEYRFVGETAPGAPVWGFRDSGVQFHSQSPQSMNIDQPFPVCLEYNLHGGNGKEERPTGEICANGTKVELDGKMNESFCTAPRVSKTFHGDQWVELELEVKDGVIKHFAGGEEIMTYSNPVLNAEHDLGKTLIKDGQIALEEGYISLQSNSHPIDFRKIELMEY